jgi:hypothetical protein
MHMLQALLLATLTGAPIAIASHSITTSRVVVTTRDVATAPVQARVANHGSSTRARPPDRMTRLLDERPTTRPRIVPRSAWDDSPAPSGLRHRRGDLRSVLRHIVVHHSDFEDPIGPAGILSYHREVSRFADIGYHFVIDAEGTIFEGRDLRAAGAHAGAVVEQKGHPERDPDHASIGIVLDGYFVDRVPNDAMLSALFALVDDLASTFTIKTDSVIPHRDVRLVLVEQRGFTLASDPTVCPGDALTRVVDRYRAARAAALLEARAR